MAIKFLNQLDLTVTSSLLKTDANGVIVAAVAGTDYLTSVTNVSGYAGTLLATDDRTIAPSELTAGRLMFGFTSWANNNTAPYADFLHLRSYTDASGGNDNLVMFRKDAIGMRVWQRAWGNSGAYSSYKDVAFTDSSITGNAATATILQTTRTINGTSFNGSANITTANWGTARTITIGATGKSVNGSGDVSWTLGEIQAEYQVPINTLRNNLGDPTVREMALFHGQFNNKFRFIAPTLQEESTDGTTWVASSRATAAQLGDMMIGEGQGTGFSAIPSGTVGTYGAYRLTWNVVGTTGYVFLNALYIYSSASGNNIGVTIERFHNTTGWETVTGPHTISNWPGHAYIPHSAIYYSNSASQYSQVRVTFTSTHNANTNAFTLYAMEWFGGYPQGRRNAEYYDRDKNVYFPAYVNGSRMVTSAVMASGTGGLAFKTSDGSDRMFLNNSGNFGIGTTSPSTRLEVLGDTEVITIRTSYPANLSQRGGLLWKDATNITGAIDTRYDGTTVDMYFGSLYNSGYNSTTRMVIKGNGNVGIGTTAPGVKLDVNGAIRATAGDSSGLRVHTNSGITASNNYMNFFTGQSNGWSFNTNGTGADSDSKVVITAAGNVGIGTTSPSYKLDISTSQSIRVVGSSNGYTQGSIIFQSSTTNSPEARGLGVYLFNEGTDATWFYGTGYGAGDTFLINRKSGATYQDSAAAPAESSNFFAITNAGNVGIGTTSPSQKLHVVGNGLYTGNLDVGHGVSTGDAAINLGTGRTGNGFAYIDLIGDTTYTDYGLRILRNNGGANTTSSIVHRGTGDFSIQNNEAANLVFLTAATERMRISSTGNVGIGTNSPAALLNVGATGTLHFTEPGIGTILLKGESGTARGMLEVHNGNSSSKVLLQAYTGGAGVGTLSNTTLDIVTNSTTRMVVTSGGNVGIGTTSPLQKLHISAGSSVIENTYAYWMNGSDYNWGIGRNIVTDTGFLTGNTLQVKIFNGATQGFQVVNSSNTAVFEVEGSGGRTRVLGGLAVGNITPSATAGRIDASNDIVAFSTSDKRLKENIAPIANALEKVKALTGVEFDWKEDTKDVHGYEGHDVGVIAQEVQSVLPEAVRSNDTGYLSVRYEKLIGLLIESNKELAARVEELEKKLK